jgi:hypothetical protein
MIRFAADEDFNNDVVRALRRALPEVNILRVGNLSGGGARWQSPLLPPKTQ